MTSFLDIRKLFYIGVLQKEINYCCLCGKQNLFTLFCAWGNCVPSFYSKGIYFTLSLCIRKLIPVFIVLKNIFIFLCLRELFLFAYYFISFCVKWNYSIFFSFLFNVTSAEGNYFAFSLSEGNKFLFFLWRNYYVPLVSNNLFHQVLNFFETFRCQLFSVVLLFWNTGSLSIVTLNKFSWQ